jgi:hypothetical protein
MEGFVYSGGFVPSMDSDSNFLLAVPFIPQIRDAVFPKQASERKAKEERELKIQEQTIAALTQQQPQTQDLSRITAEADKTKKIVLIVSGSVLLVGIIVAIVLLRNKPKSE